MKRAKNHKGMIPNLERLIRQIVKAELLSLPAVELENVKHILQVEEEADRYIVHFAKPEMMEETEVDEEDVEELASELMEEIESGMKEDDDEEKYHDDEDEDDLEEMKHFDKNTYYPNP